jgi:hypothetical protein
MLRACDRIDAYPFGDRDVLALSVGMGQGASFLPVLGGGLCVNDIGIGLRTLQNSILSSCLWIFEQIVGEGKKLRVELIGMLLRGGDRSGKFIVQKQSSSSGYMGGDRLKDLPMRLILVEAMINQVS